MCTLIIILGRGHGHGGHAYIVRASKPSEAEGSARSIHHNLFSLFSFSHRPKKVWVRTNRFDRPHIANMTTEEAMEVEDTTRAVELPVPEDEEEDVTDLEEALDAAVKQAKPIPPLLEILANAKNGPKALQLKERAVYDLTRAYCKENDYDSIVQLVVSEESYLTTLTKAKTAKVVRQILDIAIQNTTDLTTREQVARSILDWTTQQKRSFLSQRVQTRLATILYDQRKYSEALHLCETLLTELKKLDDKQLLVETHLLESKIHMQLRNLPKSKASLTASRTASNSIYVSPALQADMDQMSGTLHLEEDDYHTAHSYFLEALEQLDQQDDYSNALRCLKYMLLSKILQTLRGMLLRSSQGHIVGKPIVATDLLTNKQQVKYDSRDIQAMLAIAKAASNRDLQEYEQVLQSFQHELLEDRLIQHHLGLLKEQLLESNLIRIIEPYSCVELAHVAKLMKDMPVPVVERKLSQMILDGKFKGILDQGKGQLIVYEESEKDMAMEKGLEVIANMDEVVTSLFNRSQALRTMI